MTPAKRKANTQKGSLPAVKVVKVTHESTKFVNPKKTALIEKEGIPITEMIIDNSQFISDDEEDLLTAAALGKYQSDDGSEDEDGDEVEDDSEDEPSKESNLPTQAVRIALGDKSEGSRYFQAPSNDEIQNLKEVSELFKSNIFKLEIEELLAEVRIDYNKMKPLETTLHRLKTLFDSLPDEPDASLLHVKSHLSKDYNISIPFPDPQPASDIQYTFGFKKPKAMHLVGSFPLKTLTRSRDKLNVDVAVEMPTSLFQEKDHMNYRYFYKRAYYLAVLAKGIQHNKIGLNVKLEFSAFNGDTRRPILILNPSGDNSEVDFTKSKCVIRILPSIPVSLFSVARLSPSRNNVRPKILDAKFDPDTLSATPLYNTSILQDSSFTTSLAFLYQHAKTCPAFIDACILGKVWLHQRGLVSNGSNSNMINGFIWSMIVAHLLEAGGTNGGKKLSNGYSSYQLMKGTIDYIAQHDFCKNPIFIGHTSSEQQHFNVQEFSKNFEIIIVDPSGKVNLAAGISRMVFAQLKHEACLAQAYLNKDIEDYFDALFLKSVNDPMLYYDNIARIRLPSKVYSRYTEAAALDYTSLSEHFVRDCPTLLTEALTNRIRLISVQQELPRNWAISKPPTFKDLSTATLTIGLILNPEHAVRLVDQGPPAEDTAASNEFRKLWGNKAELRRFKDGSILESVVWDAKGAEERNLIVGRAVQYLLQLHYGIKPRDAVVYWAGQLNTFINLSQSLPEDLFNPDIRIMGFGPIMTTFDQFAKQLKAIVDLPLSVSSVTPVRPILRYSSVFLPQPIDFSKISLYPDAARYIEPIDIIITLEGSTKWPDDVAAIQRIKTAFLLKLAEQLRIHSGTKTIVVDEIDVANDMMLRGYMDVFYPPGFVFRCRIQQDRELVLLRRIMDDKKEKSWHKRLADRSLYQYNLHFGNSQMHTFHLQNLCNRFSALSSTIRLVKRWLSAHLLSSHLCDELVELLCAHVFLDPQPWIEPGSSFVGFSRVLRLLSTWSWKNEALIVDLEGNMAAAIKDKVKDNFKKLRAENALMKHATMFVATGRDLESKHWSWLNPSKVIVARLQILAAAALSLLSSTIVDGKEDDVKRLFMPPLQDYDFIIHFEPSKCTRYFQNIEPDTQYFGNVSKFKNLQVQKSVLGNQPLIGFDPVELFLRDLKTTYSDSAIFFHDHYGGSFIAVAWKPVMLTPRQWRLDLGYSNAPVEMNDNGKMKSHGLSKLVAANIESMMVEMERLGAGLVSRIEKIEKRTL
ncbi:hypothetical protein BC937DRAFT_87483 [Endogone sp. FLAS-F59071]|nr:hypothetical protein BC937DRAFT_87483 [Endogone sp. FLAS-F59071]|eukprot:RUS22739.1 hypothetical protein BC937DRAFT_87483 [Endogone sp. FLAS-F59071]